LNSANKLIIIPTWNEAKNIEVLIPRVFNHVENCSILVVDDGSPDATAVVVEKLTEEFKNLILIVNKKKEGLGSAYRTGFKWGLANGYKFLIEMDADLSHRVRDLSNLIRASLEYDADVVIGSRWIAGGKIENWSKKRELLSRMANRYVRLMLRIDVNDSTSGFRIYKSELFERLDLSLMKSEGYSFQIEMTRASKLAGAKIVEVPITFRERESGVSKMSGAIVREAMLLVTVWGFKRFFRMK
jgi:dolichol-phosphate mannosyltransferase